MKRSFSYDTPAGRIYIAEADGFITDLLFSKIADAEECETPLIRRAADELHGYFCGVRREFTLPLNPCGTDFQKRAWRALLEIPYGQTRTYKQQAAAAGNEKACRAVGAANGKNPICIIIPCHRVVGSNKSLTGYGGGLDKKEFLLNLEQRITERRDYNG